MGKRKERPILGGVTHGRSCYRQGCGCDVGRKAESDYQAKRRAENGRAQNGNVIPMSKGPAISTKGMRDAAKKRTESRDSVKRAEKRAKVGAMEQAVIDEYELLDADCKRPTVLIAARNLAKIVDDPDLQGMHIATTKQVMAMMQSLRPKEIDAKKRKSGGRMATVGALVKVKRGERREA